MVKTNMSVSDMMTQPHYRSIFTLTSKFDRGEGLQQIHYRYALQEKHGLSDYHQKKMENYFGKKLEKFFIESDILEKGGELRRAYRNCIKEGTYLSYYLKQMVEHGLLVKIKNSEEKTSYQTKYLNYFVHPIKDLARYIKKLSPIYLSFFYSGGLNVWSLDEKTGVAIDSDFIQLPEDVFNPDEEHKKEFVEVMKNISRAVSRFGEYVKKVVPPNITSYEATREPTDTHSFSIFLDCRILSEKLRKEIEEHEPDEFDEEEDKLKD